MNYQGFECPNLDDVTMKEAHKWSAIFSSLSLYAAKISAAKSHRFNGQVHLALPLEKQAEILYNQLPKEIRW